MALKSGFKKLLELNEQAKTQMQDLILNELKRHYEAHAQTHLKVGDPKVIMQIVSAALQSPDRQSKWANMASAVKALGRASAHLPLNPKAALYQIKTARLYLTPLGGGRT